MVIVLLLQDLNKFAPGNLDARESNKEMDEILAFLKIPTTKVIVLETPLTLKFKEFVSEMEIVLLLQDLNKFAPGNPDARSKERECLHLF